MRVSRPKYLCTACASKNYNQTIESYAQAAAKDAVVVEATFDFVAKNGNKFCPFDKVETN